MNMIKKTILLIAIALVALTASADKKTDNKSTIHLRSGQVVSGTIINRTDAVVEILNDADGLQYSYGKDEINYIEHAHKAKNYDTSKFRGFIDLGYSLGVGTPRNDYWLLETSFGYAITPKFYVGGGLAVHNFNAKINTFPEWWDKTNWDEKTDDEKFNDPNWRYPFIPLYAEVRYSYRNESKNTPFASMKIGGTFINHKGLFASPTIGYHLAGNQFFSFNIGISYQLQTATYKLWCKGDTPGAIPDQSGKSYLNKTQAFQNVALKVGVEF